jgi:short chain dehydrogenase
MALEPAMTATPPVALVTGASSGIGKAAALALSDAGFRMIGTSRNSSRVTPGNGVTFLDLDVTSGESVVNVVQQVIDRRRRHGDRRGCHRPETEAALPRGLDRWTRCRATSHRPRPGLRQEHPQPQPDNRLTIRRQTFLIPAGTHGRDKS